LYLLTLCSKAAMNTDRQILSDLYERVQFQMLGVVNCIFVRTV